MFKEKIELVCVKRQLSKPELAHLLGMSPQNFYRKLKRDNFSEDDMKKVAEALNCRLDITMQLNDTGEKF